MTPSIQSPLSPHLTGRALRSLDEINSLLMQRGNAQYVLDYADGVVSQDSWEDGYRHNTYEHRSRCIRQMEQNHFDMRNIVK